MKFILSSILSMLAFASFAQVIDFKQVENYRARSIGPAGMSGRVTSIDVVRNQPEVIYIGTASGGVWKSTSGGISWTPIFDDQPIQNIGSIAIHQENPSIVWAGTGEGNPRNSQSSGAGIYKSVDAGKTWKLMGLEKTKTIHRIVLHPKDPNTIYVAATGSAWGPNSERGVFRSRDGGSTWKKVLYVNDTTGCADLVIDPSNPNKLIAGMWQYLRQPWFFESGGAGSGMYVSLDGGDNWSRRTEKNGMPKGELGRIGIAFAPSMPSRVYALIEAKENGLYRSDDGGANWKKVSSKNIGNRPFYYSEIYVDPKNENRIYNLYSLMSMSEDAGRTFEIVLPYSNVHPDHQAFYVHPDDPNFLINGNDGGLNISRDRGENWRFVSNLPLGQFYHINIDDDFPYNVYGGMQDNGSWVGPSSVLQRGGIRNSHWDELYFGDGFDVVPFPGNNRYGYAMSQGGNVAWYDIETGKTRFVQPNHPEGEELRFNWNAAIHQSSFSDSTLFFGSQYVHRSDNLGRDWKVISPDLTTNDSTKQKQAKSGGLTIDATRAENFTSILCIEQNPLDSNVLWVGTDDGRLNRSIDGGKTWTEHSASLKGLPKGSWIPQIVSSKSNREVLYVVANNYRRNDWKPYLYMSSNGGKTFSRLVSEGDLEGYCLSIQEDPVESKLLYLGTEQGLWISIDKGYTWSKFRNGLPAVSTMDMKVHPEGDLVLGTFGRAAFILDDLEPLRQLAREGEAMFSKDLILFKPPTAYQIMGIKPVSGPRFAGDSEFKGQNKNFGAMLSLWIRELEKEEESKDEEEEKKEEKTKKSKIELQVFDEKGKLIRTQKFSADTGFNRIYWDRRINGKRMYAHEKPKEKNIPGGAMAKPGTYGLKVSYGAFSDSNSVVLKPDPRIDYNEKEWNDWHMTLAEADSLKQIAKKAFNQMREVQEGMKSINAVKYAEMDLDIILKQEISDEIKSMSEGMKKIEDQMILPKDFTGYDHVTVRLNNRMGRMMNYLYAEQNEPNSNAQVEIDGAKKMLDSILAELGPILEKWESLRKKVNEANLMDLEAID
ncbi:hypothetical protein N9C06_02900 [Salibacteraceae bacterium]|jgi:photosystem II stability/assembly factor-like uncharacterized protein|nr:hypothetical protein [Salibacteraceae bacterium]